MQLRERLVNGVRRYVGLIRAMAGQLHGIGNEVHHLRERVANLETAVSRHIDASFQAPEPKPLEAPAVYQPVWSDPMSEAHAAASSFPIPKFWEPNFWEAMVQIALRDYCKPGDIAFDVGANAGALSAIMSRHVGPRGIVCAFEASPRIIDKTHYNLVQAGCSNVSLYYRAVYHTSHEIVTLYPGDHLNDSIYNDLGAEGGASYRVETLALDDFVAATGLMPRIIKMDIEGAELDALKGATRILADGKPILILEQSPGDMTCHELLTGAGYVAVDLSNYRRIRSAADFDAGISIANILFIHESQAAEDRYFNAGEPVEVARLTPEMFAIAPNGNVSLKTHFELPAGRYVCRTEFTAEGRDNEIFAGIDTDRGRVQRYHTYSRLMAETYRDWAFNMRVAGQITPYIEFVRGSDPSFRWNGAVIYRYAGFDGMHSPVVF
ncbi:FkbM family methyltransferase [Bosea sp. (in: a-proteobacteria)]|jgi:FkbM family methyltransferase|uniref:FkbM family methyltransferase n=1 Tax=Bosea sp. (in: a-proteobacteria) TaxID=1871050 RepID=UPI003564B2B4